MGFLFLGLPLDGQTGNDTKKDKEEENKLWIFMKSKIWSRFRFVLMVRFGIFAEVVLMI